MVLCLPGALVAGNSFDLVFDNFVKTALMCVLIAAAVRGVRDVERLALGLPGGGDGLCGGRDARASTSGPGPTGASATSTTTTRTTLPRSLVTAMPLGFYFLQAGRGLRTRAFAAAALAI